MTEFHDPELEHLLGRTGGPFPDVNVAYERVQGRVRTAKRRRVAVVGAAACSLLLGAGALAAGRSDGSDSVRPADGDTEVGNTDADRLQPDSTIATTIAVTTTTLPASTTSSTSSTVAAETTTIAVDTTVATASGGNTGGGSGTGGGSTKTTTPVRPKPTVPTATVPPATTPVTEPPATTPATTAVPAPVTATFRGVGGSVVVRMENGALVLVSFQANDGFHADVRRQSGSHVEVRFESRSHRTTARVDLEHDTMVQHFDEEDS
jgi:hypothetical protein